MFSLLLGLAAQLPAPLAADPTAPPLDALPAGAEAFPVPSVIVYREDLDLRDRLIRVAGVRADPGRFVVANLDPRLEPALERHGAIVETLPELAEDEQLWLVPLAALGAVGSELPLGAARLLFRGPAGSPSLVAVAEFAEEAFLEVASTSGHNHCGLSPVPARTLRPAPAVTWRGRSGAEGVLAMSTADPRLQVLVDQVDPAAIEARVHQLAGFFNRRADQPGAAAAQSVIEGWFQGIGLTPTTQSFDPQFSSNVIAEIPGVLDPNKVVVIGAHYDSINLQGSASSVAPGADDNASGTSGVIEAAKALAQGGPYEHTIRFITFSAEEFGLIGASANAAQSLSDGEEILGMLNMDMIAYRAAGDARDVDFVTNNTSASLNEFCAAVGALYVPNWASTQGTLTAGSSDHAAYNSFGFPATFFFEDTGQFSPFIHTPNDSLSISAVDYDLAQLIVRGVVAAAGTLAEPLDLDLAHTPLGDTPDGIGPYLVTAQVTSLTGSNVVGVDLNYSGDGTNFTTIAMTDQGGGTYAGLIPSFGPLADISYWIQALDDEGGSEVSPLGADLGGAPHRFFVGTKNVVYQNDFEGPTDEGWVHAQVATQDDWQRGEPEGKGGDPAAAFSGDSVWGNDLGPDGFNGTYQPNVVNFLRSPSIDASGVSSLALEFRRWLTVEDATFDQAQILVNNQLVWQNPVGSSTDHLIDSEWVPFELDITAEAAGSSDVQVEFRLVSDGGLEFGGWNLDDFLLVEKGPAPPPPAPTFTLDPSSSVAVGFEPIVASGTGLGGVQSVTVNGTSVAFEQGAGQVTFLAPAATQLGAVDVVITTAVGSSAASLSYQPNPGTVIAGTASVGIGQVASFAVGDPDPGAAWLIFSAAPGSTDLPGIANLAIGGGNPLAIFIGGSGALNSAGNYLRSLTLPNNPGLSGTSLFFEGVVFGPALTLAASGAFELGIE